MANIICEEYMERGFTLTLGQAIAYIGNMILDKLDESRKPPEPNDA